ncbi:hypothetical protein PMAYCL1PPCAC_00080, partial [Pristionchus mayeri]
DKGAIERGRMSSRKRQLSETREDSPATKRRGRQLKNSASAAAAGASGSEREWETDERLLGLTKLIMFSAGDSNEPYESNAHMLLGLMQQQVRMIVKGAMERAKIDGRDAITLRDLMGHAARHKLVIGRLLNHAKAAHYVSSLSRHTKEEEEEEEKEE